MRVVVSGATGFIGGQVSRLLRSRGHDVLGLGRDPERGAALVAAGIGFEGLDLADIPAVRSWDHAEVFVHAAGLSAPWGPRAAFDRANVAATRNALAVARTLKARRFVFLSSAGVGFRFADQLEAGERAALPVPVNDHAATKVIAEDLVRGAGIDSIVLRLRTVYGPGDPGFLPRLVRAAGAGPIPLLRRGAAVTDLTYIDDAAAAVLCAVTAPPEITGTYNVSGGEAVSIREIVTRICQEAGVLLRLIPMPVAVALASARLAESLARLRKDPPEPPITALGVGILAFSQTLNIAAARAELGYRPQVPFAEGLRRTFL